MRLLAPAKINLHLRVGPKGDDGFHPLLTWMTTVGLFDTLVLEKIDAPVSAQRAAADEQIRIPQLDQHIALSCDVPDLPCDQRNLVWKVAQAFKQELESGDNDMAAGKLCGVKIALQKRIAIGAGLGGGSSDAAATLLGLNRLWDANWTADSLSAFAARFGSDLSFFFHGASSICRGRGQMVQPIAAPRVRWVVLVLPGFGLATADVYRRFDQLSLGRPNVEAAPDWIAWTKFSSEELLPLLVNDLEAAAFAIAPQLADLRQRVEKTLQRPVRMSGSGSTLFTLFDSAEMAHAAAAQIERQTQVRASTVELSPNLLDGLNE